MKINSDISDHLSLRRFAGMDVIIVESIQYRHTPQPLVLHSSNTVHKSAPPMSRRSGRPSPHPRFRPMIELFGGYPRSQFDLLVVSKVLPGQGFSAEHPPPCLLQVQPG